MTTQETKTDAGPGPGVLEMCEISVLEGPSASGKSHLAADVAIRTSDYWAPVIFAHRKGEMSEQRRDDLKTRGCDAILISCAADEPPLTWMMRVAIAAIEAGNKGPACGLIVLDGLVDGATDGGARQVLWAAQLLAGATEAHVMIARNTRRGPDTEPRGADALYQAASVVLGITAKGLVCTTKVRNGMPRSWRFAIDDGAVEWHGEPLL